MNAVKVKKANADIHGFTVPIAPIVWVALEYHRLTSTIGLNHIGATTNRMFKRQLIKWGDRAIGFFTPAARKDG